MTASPEGTPVSGDAAGSAASAAPEPIPPHSALSGAPAASGEVADDASIPRRGRGSPQDHSAQSLATRLVALESRDPETGASSIPIYQCSTFDQEDPEHLGTWDYSRSGNPTREALEKSIADLEGGARGLAFASGMAAISSTLLLLRPGDHVVAGSDIYGGAYRVLSGLFARWGIETTFVDAADPAAVEAALRPATQMIYLETPSNPLLRITPIAEIAALARARQILTIVDNTFATPWLQRPIALGVDIVVHSATKFLGGHSDVVAGLAVARDKDLGRRLHAVQNAFGAVLGPQDSWLVLRGMRTLGVRMEAQQKTATRLAAWLRGRPEVRAVHHPSLPGHPGREVHEGQAAGPGAVLSFELADRARAVDFLKRVTIPMVGVSLGGVESILSYPATMSHAAMGSVERAKRGISDGLVRLSAGLEAAEDLEADFDQALR